MSEENTTLTLSKKTKERLDELKVHPRMSYDELLSWMAREVKKIVEMGS